MQDTNRLVRKPHRQAVAISLRIYRNRRNPQITHLGLDSRRFILVTDDSHAQTISQDGHMDRVLRHAIEQGLTPVTAIQMMTINTAEHFGLTKEMGMIAPGRWADILLVHDLMKFKADLVIAKGQVIAEDGEWQIKLPTVKYPKWLTNSVHLKRSLKAEDFVLRARASHKSSIEAHMIGVIENQAPTHHLAGIRAHQRRDPA